MNLLHYFLTSHMDEDQRKQLDAALERAERPEGEKKSRVPKWWKGDAAAAASMVQAARDLNVLPAGAPA